jgi:ABC-type uncharacterized transport system fused permease/ATPase subunit
MTDRPEEASDASAAKEEAAQSKLIPQMTMMFRALLDSHVRDQLFILAGVLVAVVGATAYGQIRLNTWNQPFYDAIERQGVVADIERLRVPCRRPHVRDTRLYGVGRCAVCRLGVIAELLGGQKPDQPQCRWYAREADLRFSLVRVNEHVDAIALARGEADEARRIEVEVAAVLAATRRLVLGLTNLTWVTAGYGWFTLVAPILAASPLYFSGNLSFGGLMMAAGAFTQVQTSMRWFVDNFSVIADWRATLLRVASFRRAILSTDTLHRVESQIAFEDGEAGHLRIQKLEIASPAGCTLVKEKSVNIERGERS